MSDRAAHELRKLLGADKVIDGPGVQRAYDCDAYSIDRNSPSVVVLPESTEDVQAVVLWCNDHQVPFVARGAGTGLSGGSMPALGGVVISTKRMNRILAIDIENRCLLAQCGIANQRVTDAVREHGLHFAPDPSSQSVSTLGGNIAENSGGPHTLKYGVTVQHILGLTLITPEGSVAEFGGMLAGSPGYDFLGLIVGSEGTLGIVTEAWVKLTPLPIETATGLVAFSSIRGATEAVSAIVASGIVPAALELMDKGILRALNAAFGLTYPEGSEALLLIECDKPPPCSSKENEEGGGASAHEDLLRAVEICAQHSSIEARIAGNEAERQELWRARKKGIGAMGRLAPTIVTHDGVIPRTKLPEMLDFVYSVSERYGIGVANLFHAGDGNLHPCFYFDDRDPKQVEFVIKAGEEILAKCVELGGSISGEHGIGVEKLDLMGLMFSEDDLRVQALVKSIFNRDALCNPCKVLPNQKGCVEHQRRWRGAAW